MEKIEEEEEEEEEIEMKIGSISSRKQYSEENESPRGAVG